MVVMLAILIGTQYTSVNASYTNTILVTMNVENFVKSENLQKNCNCFHEILTKYEGFRINLIF